MSRILMIAAEASSVLYAEKLMDEWTRQGTHHQYFGVGSNAMEAKGFQRFGKSEEMAVVGLVEVLKHYRFLKSIFNSILQEVDRAKPDLAVLLDYPGFNLRLAKELKKRGVRVVYYIPPQVWAWKQDRVYQIKESCDLVLSLFPFETEFYKKFGVPVKFVGHPLLDEIDPDLLDADKANIKRGQMGVRNDEAILGIMPGSRRIELELNFPTQIRTAQILLRKYPELRVAFLVAPNFEKEDLLPYLENFGWPYMIIKDDPFRMVHLCDLILVTSGTATLVVGLMEKPMIIMYKLKALTAFIARMIVPKTTMFGLVNVIHGQKVIPEIFQEEANPENLSQHLEKILIDQEYRQQMLAKLKELKTLLGEKGATQRVVAILSEMLKSKSGS